jgi:hypothetical protein
VSSHATPDVTREEDLAVPDFTGAERATLVELLNVRQVWYENAKAEMHLAQQRYELLVGETNEAWTQIRLLRALLSEIKGRDWREGQNTLEELEGLQ